MTLSEVIFESKTSPNEVKKINIIHFNDVYNVEENSKEPVGGAARFVNAIEKLNASDESTMVIFSGDALSPSASKNKILKQTPVN
jgi:2',3'-cyclic-nucleotide 2'-phosphodiesterase (5'-nucleotidase family)